MTMVDFKRSDKKSLSQEDVLKIVKNMSAMGEMIFDFVTAIYPEVSKEDLAVYLNCETSKMLFIMTDDISFMDTSLICADIYVQKEKESRAKNG